MLIKFKRTLPGFLIATITGLAALFLSEHYGAPAMLFALLLGIALSFLSEGEPCKAGIELSATHVLRLGIALLGLRIAFGDLAELGWQTALILIFATLSTIALGVLLAKIFGVNQHLGLLTGGAVGICGASATMAISSILPPSPDNDRNTLVTIVGVTAFSTLAMVAYPIIATMLNLDTTQTSIFLGGTIHDVAQVVGAGYSVSEQTGNLATLTKLVRVAFLMPIIFALLIMFNLKRKAKRGHAGSKTPGMPRFLIAFFILMLINSLIDLPPFLLESSHTLSRFSLVVAIAAIGMKSNLKQLLTVGIKPFLLLAIESFWIASIILLCLLIPST